jgi:hypothetical protein
MTSIKRCSNRESIPSLPFLIVGINEAGKVSRLKQGQTSNVQPRNVRIVEPTSKIAGPNDSHFRNAVSPIISMDVEMGMPFNPLAANAFSPISRTNELEQISESLQNALIRISRNAESHHFQQLK